MLWFARHVAVTATKTLAMCLSDEVCATVQIFWDHSQVAACSSLHDFSMFLICIHALACYRHDN